MINTAIDFTQLSLMDALDLAVLIEEEAEERYVTFANMLGSRYEGDAADFFQTMSRYEAKHAAQLRDKRMKLFAATPLRLNKELVEDVEAPDYGTPRPFMSTPHAFEVALDCEKKAEAFYVSALSVIADPQVKDLFTELRDQEIEHQRMIQRQMAKISGDASPDVPPEDIDTPAL
ncbi:MAG: ferritin family protein [Pirellulales bacterium]|nr:ferritin family protein [Pirellulales bacterium]